MLFASGLAFIESDGSRHRLNLSAGIGSIAIAILLVALKAWGLLMTGALSVAASLVDSALDLAASGLGLMAILYAARPPDEDHSFGHTSIEDLVALGQAALVVVSAVLIAWRALDRLEAPPELGSEQAGILILTAGTLLTIALVAWQSYVVRRTGSRIVAADRLHYLSDLLPSLGAIAALAAGQAGYLWADPAIALIACCLLLNGARGIGMPAWNALMDRRADPALVTKIEAIVASHPGVSGYHDLRTRTAGARIFVQVHIELDGNQSLAQAHAISARLRRAILAAVPEADVIIHKDPL